MCHVVKMYYFFSAYGHRQSEFMVMMSMGGRVKIVHKMIRREKSVRIMCNFDE